ncbi:ATP-dependent Clp protease proteolytic subunit [uncultured Devosia sp.]|uniref:ATP-dependent Clp protease proteolytic subunit n=1 Tax=uncultured Devosia sp. TaxID=211434 RepID=UPI0035C9AC02
MRVAFFALLLGTLSVLFVDYRQLTANQGTALAAPMPPILPAIDPAGPAQGPAPAITTSPDVLEQPLAITLQPGGVLALTGTFDLGAAARFATEIEARGEYVATIVLDSPGGSVEDALAIAALIHERAFGTAVAAGALCASSCPLVLAAGVTRTASDQAAIGVHQIYAAQLSGDPQTALRVAGTAMADAQTTTARITRFLATTGVDPAIWLHALETPPDRLYYLTPAEMTKYRLVTALQNQPATGT